MARIIIVILATLFVEGTTPTLKNPGPDCADKQYVSAYAVGKPLTLVLIYFGPSAGIRFVASYAGEHFVFMPDVLPGRYNVHVIARNGRLVSCDTMIVKDTEVVRLIR